MIEIRLTKRERCWKALVAFLRRIGVLPRRYNWTAEYRGPKRGRVWRGHRYATKREFAPRTRIFTTPEILAELEKEAEA